MNLFCLPPAGSSASLYSGWKKLTTDNINLIPLEYPGHGTLVRQALIHDPDQLSRYILDKIQAYGDQPFALFGHSVGAALAWRVEQLLQQTPLQAQIKLLIVSGRPEMTFTKDMAPKRFLTREGLIKALKHYNGVPEELLQNDDAMDFFLTILRNDFHLNDNMLQDQVIKTNTPLMAFYGEDDPDIANHQQMEAWQNHSYQWLGCHALAGDHFFFNNPDSLQTMIHQICATVAEKPYFT